MSNFWRCTPLTEYIQNGIIDDIQAELDNNAYASPYDAGMQIVRQLHGKYALSNAECEYWFDKITRFLTMELTCD